MTHIEALSEFFQKFEASLDPRLWVKLVEEETQEFREARWLMIDSGAKQDKADALKEAADLIYVTTGLAILLESGENLYRFLIGDEEADRWEEAIRQANAQLKIATTIFGAELLRTAFERVHESNLSKLGDDGKPLRREDGKILKGPNYQAPDLTDLV
jgi:predicted HAD superfamily Cof-like phosphohydrolase